jgi:hypothetical protein
VITEFWPTTIVVVPINMAGHKLTIMDSKKIFRSSHFCFYKATAMKAELVINLNEPSLNMHYLFELGSFTFLPTNVKAK